MLLRLLSAACLVAAAAVASPRPPEEEAFEVERKSTPLLAKKSGVASSDSCSLDATLASMTMGDMERLIERFAKLQGMTVSGVVKQLYSALYSSIKRKVAGEEVCVTEKKLMSEGLSPMALEAIQELCLGGAGPAYQLVPPHGPIFSGLSSAFMPNTEFAPLPPIRNLRPPPGAKLLVQTGGEDLDASITVSPKMSLVEALRRADYKLAADTGRGSGVLHLGFSATRACYIVESVAGVRASPERAWKITISDRFGKLVYEDICLPSTEDLVVQPRMKITLTYVETKRKTQ
ncbi:hypothetical protein HPB52_015292 [Rhipicephalus sanguineus]|uniref:Uncharacterized protein n=1 Tax=Rhipicephalus sanguineus TaxID=34632 RepID=A0A9D4PWU3_RHISA|nr:hypothetical protein HPB52_015292 [Rhipicephalus sanguineus]